MTHIKTIVFNLKAAQLQFARGLTSSLEHSQIREQFLVEGIQSMAHEFGIELEKPIINSNGEFPINIKKEGNKKTEYGEHYANWLTKYNPRTGTQPGAILDATNNWCFLDHFSAEKMVIDYISSKK
jgi:hypothetical protein